MKNLILSAVVTFAAIGVSSCTGGGGSGGTPSDLTEGRGSNSANPSATDANGMARVTDTTANADGTPNETKDAPGMPNAEVSPDQHATTSGTSSGTQSVPKVDEKAEMKKKLDASRPGTSKDL